MTVPAEPWLWADPPSAADPARRPLAEVIRDYRRRAGWTQAELAKLLHIDQSYVSKIESGRRIVRDVGQLVLLSKTLGIPPAELGLSDELAQIADRRGAGPAVAPPEVSPVGVDRAAAIVASQDEWRTVRRYLNQHRSELAREAVELYPNAARIGRTPLISPPAWLPTAPVELSRISLVWQDRSARPRVVGEEPEARWLLPLCAPGKQYDRYTSAVRYLDPPTLFENRASYRLLDVEWSGDTGRLRFGLATYFDKLDVSEAVGHEQAAAALSQERDGARSPATWAQLPFRGLVGDPFDCTRRAVVPAVTTLTVRIDPGGGPPGFLLHWRDPARVATAGGMYDVIPAGEFQPSSVAMWDQANDFDLWRNIVRELSEELLGAPEHDGSRSAPIDYEGWSLYRALERARRDGLLYVSCLGLGLDALTLAATILTVIVIDGPTFDEVFADVVRVNAEGFTVAAGHDQRIADGIPFTEANVRRLLRSEPLASPGAACLHLAWRRRELLTSVLTGT